MILGKSLSNDDGVHSVNQILSEASVPAHDNNLERFLGVEAR